MNRQSDRALIEAHQENLLYLGFDLGRWGADGDLGTVTKNASHDAAFKFSLPPPVGSEIPDELVIGLSTIVAKKKAEGTPVRPANFFDLSEDAYDTPRVKRVPLTQWTGVTIHQTGCPMGMAGWPDDRRHKRWARHEYTDPKTKKFVKTSLKAHIGITRLGEVLLIHPLEWFIWHAQAQSHTHIGIEIEAFARGIEGDARTLPSGGFPWVEASDAQMLAAVNTVRWIDAVLHRYGGALKFINGHGNADNWRAADPGSRIYQGVVLECIRLLGLSDQGPRYKTGDGRYTPEAWNPAYVGNPY